MERTKLSFLERAIISVGVVLPLIFVGGAGIRDVKKCYDEDKKYSAVARGVTYAGLTLGASYIGETFGAGVVLFRRKWKE